MRNFNNPLHETAETTITDIWNDSCAEQEMGYAMENGAVGATTNPVIVHSVVKSESGIWIPEIRKLIKETPSATEDELAWILMEKVLKERAAVLLPVYEASKGKKGKIAIQVNAKNFRNAEEMAKQAIYFNSLAPNITVKIPATKAGIEAMKTATEAGVSILATVNFTVSQTVAVAKAVEEGLKSREAAGKDISGMTPGCAIMVGRTDDWLKVYVNNENIITDPGCLEWAGVAVFKKSYKIIKERNYRIKLMSAAYRNHFHWSEFIGGDVILTIPYKWQKRFNSSNITVEERIENPVSEEIIMELTGKIPEFVKAYEEEGLSPEEFDSYGALLRTMRSFTEGYDNLVRIIRDLLLPNPDIK